MKCSTYFIIVHLEIATILTSNLNFQTKVALKAFWSGNLYFHSSLDLFGSHPDIMLFRIFKCGL